MTFSFRRTAFAAATISLMTGQLAGAMDVSGAGATFPFPVYAKWADAYKKDSGHNLNYQSIGSGGGIKQITARTVTFGAPTCRSQPTDLATIGVIQFPTVWRRRAGCQSHGIEPGDVMLDGPTLARTSWADQPGTTPRSRS